MNIFGMNLEELQQELHSSMSLPKFRAKQILEWIYQRGAASFEEMTNLSKELRGELALRYEIGRATLRDRLDSYDGKTSKFLLAFPDNTSVEAVLMRQHYGNSICISSQAGCNMGCVFCASALRGMDRNLEKGEFLAQTIYINELLKEEGEKVDTIVVMGSGEPLMNYD
ncbi:MAG: 23S rRNA (adenine(2503)-C(2))-methyltransferase RlmN, partial [Selenomonadaceae bacterium]|nr:23S rRNA (adenine(2503)-C(2))-methyltransferase RlmN [Selenomonadaceae bacterium]